MWVRHSHNCYGHRLQRLYQCGLLQSHWQWGALSPHDTPSKQQVFQLLNVVLTPMRPKCGGRRVTGRLQPNLLARWPGDAEKSKNLCLWGPQFLHSTCRRLTWLGLRRHRPANQPLRSKDESDYAMPSVLLGRTFSSKVVSSQPLLKWRANFRICFQYLPIRFLLWLEFC